MRIDCNHRLGQGLAVCRELPVHRIQRPTVLPLGSIHCVRSCLQASQAPVAEHWAVLPIAGQLVIVASRHDLELAFAQDRDGKRWPTQLALCLIQFPSAIPCVRLRRNGQGGYCQEDGKQAEPTQFLDLGIHSSFTEPDGIGIRRDWQEVLRDRRLRR